MNLNSSLLNRHVLGLSCKDIIFNILNLFMFILLWIWQSGLLVFKTIWLQKLLLFFAKGNLLLQ